MNFDETTTWRNSLSATGTDGDAVVEKLRVAFLDLRRRAGVLLGEIVRDLPDFTQHELSHCDALWEMADLVTGEAVKINPMEGFVLGAVFLLHDAALTLAALPNRADDLKRDPLWADTVVSLLKKKLGRVPTDEEIASVENRNNLSAFQDVCMNLLRLRHADSAEKLASQPFIDNERNQTFLIQDEQLRSHFGRVVGQISASHGWDLNRVEQEFGRSPLFAPVAGYPRAWQVDRLKLACLIRTCDAIQIDSRRAPQLLAATRPLADSSRPHWQLQQHIAVARDDDRIRFTSGFAFPASQAQARAWWTGFELAQNAHRELAQVDALLADLGRPRLAARGVWGAESSLRFRATVPTEGWDPVDARVRVSDVAKVAKNLGGESLYGVHVRGLVPLRELIQNACDAVRARRLQETGAHYQTRDLGEVIVRQGIDENGHWIEVQDNGLGMSPYVLTNTLLDFGSSLWNSADLHREWPGLEGRKFQATGRFGIGFFSVFMWGERVRVTSRRYDKGRDEAHVLEWEQGLDWHPLFRVAAPEERVADGGTQVRVWTKQLEDGEPRLWPNLEQLCLSLCPALDTNLFIDKSSEQPNTDGSSTSTQLIQANDWINGDGKELLRRVWMDYYNFDSLRSPELLDALAGAMRPLRQGEEVIGRACLFDWNLGFELFGTANYRTGCVTVGGLRAAEIVGFAGVLVGQPTRAARDEAIPIVDAEELARWATEQATLFAQATTSLESNTLINRHIAAATLVRRFGGLTGPLIITARGAENGFLPLSYDDIIKVEDLPDEIVFLDFRVLDGARLAESVRLHPHVFLTTFDSPSLLFRMERLEFIQWQPQPPARVKEVADPDWQTRYQTLFGALIEAVAARWGCSIDEVLAASTLRNKADDPPVEREIGFINDKPVVQVVSLLRRPQHQKSSTTE